MSVPALPGETRTNEILHFYLMHYYYLIQITLKTYCVHIFDILAHISCNCSVFQLPNAKLFKMSAHCMNTGTKIISLFIDSSVDNVLLHTNLDFISRVLNS